MNYGGEEIEVTHPFICPLCGVASTVTPRCAACPTGCSTARRAARSTLGLRDGRELGLRR